MAYQHGSLRHVQPLAPTLQILFTQLYSTSSLPDNWLTANVTPVYKKGTVVRIFFPTIDSYL